MAVVRMRSCFEWNDPERERSAAMVAGSVPLDHGSLRAKPRPKVMAPGATGQRAIEAPSLRFFGAAASATLLHRTDIRELPGE